MQAAQLKLLAALPAEWQADARRVSSRFHLDPIGWFNAATPVNHLPAIAEAVWTERRIRVRYESWKDVRDRELDPLGLVLKAGNWYLIAGSDGRLRTFRLSNILQLTALDAHFKRPPDFDLARYWVQSAQRFEAGIYRDSAVLRVSPQGLKLLQRMSPAVAEAATRTAETPDGEGWVRVVVPIESIDHAAHDLLRLRAEAEVVAPPALRERLAGTAQRLAALYGAAPTAAPGKASRSGRRGSPSRARVPA
jgi:predicted DNA-binding transcriptional regulator YafY